MYISLLASRLAPVSSIRVTASTVPTVKIISLPNFTVNWPFSLLVSDWAFSTFTCGLPALYLMKEAVASTRAFMSLSFIALANFSAMDKTSGDTKSVS
jgi:hypothetical protein